jgi:hypothetical protein
MKARPGGNPRIRSAARNPRAKRRQNTRDKLPPHEIEMKEVCGQLVPVKVFPPAWAEGVTVPSMKVKK